jgi:AAA15 family ATPase/GTPase
MKIQNVILHNIQSFKHARIEFSDKINLIIGKNNTGKSAVLRSLLCFQQGTSQRPELLLRKFEDDGFVFATVIDPVSIPTTKKINHTDTQAILYQSKNGQYSWMSFPSSVSVESDILGLVEIARRDGALLGISQYSDIEPNNIFLPFLAKRKTQYNHQGQFDEQSLKQIESDFRNLPTKLNRAKSNVFASKFGEACLDILGFIPSTLPTQKNTNLATVAHYVGTDDAITLDQMGDGVSQTIGLLVNLFHARKKIFIIEEPENDLHPEALKKLLQLIIKFSTDNQFIISTHSNIVMRILGSEPETRIFETKTELVKDDNLNTELFNSTINEVDNSPEEKLRILYELGYELIDSHLWDGYIILEESSAEHLIANFLLPHFTPKLVGRLRTIAAKGAGDVRARYHHLQSLFTYIHTSPIYKNKGWVLVDGDAAGKEAIKALRNDFKRSWDPEYFKEFSKENFEDFYPSEYEKEIEIINNESDWKKCGKLKVDLAKQVVDDYLNNPEAIAKRFEHCAKEVIDILKQIEQALCNQGK